MVLRYHKNNELLRSVGQLTTRVFILAFITVFLAPPFSGYAISVNSVRREILTEIWSANFETGDNSQFNLARADSCTNGTIGVTSSIVHTGKYAGYYSGKSNYPFGSCREYPSLSLFLIPYKLLQPITSFRLSIWVYLPYVALNGWVSFITLGSNDTQPITLDADRHQQLTLFVSSSNGNQIITQNVGPRVKFPFNEWFNINVEVLRTGAQDEVIVYQDAKPIISFTGTALRGPLAYAHFGLYMSKEQASFAILNDDITLEKISISNAPENSCTAILFPVPNSCVIIMFVRTVADETSVERWGAALSRLSSANS